MRSLPHARAGELFDHDRGFPRSAATRGSRQYSRLEPVDTVDAWAVLRRSARDRIEDATERREARAFLQQGHDFYTAARTRRSASPLLYYDSFLSIAKALVRINGFAGSLDHAMHGLTASTALDGVEIRDSEVAVRDSGTVASIYPELIQRLGDARPADGSSVRVEHLLPQVLLGHRHWRRVTGASERFLAVRGFEIAHDLEAKELWLRLYLARADLTRMALPRATLIASADLYDFHEVRQAGLERRPGQICLEQIRPASYARRPSDSLPDLAETIRPRLWRIAAPTSATSANGPYLYLSPSSERSSRVPQLASLWLLAYYFGTVVRYRPHVFRDVATGELGPFIREFFAAQPEQVLHLLAAEIRRTRSVKPAIV